MTHRTGSIRSRRYGVRPSCPREDMKRKLEYDCFVSQARLGRRRWHAARFVNETSRRARFALEQALRAARAGMSDCTRCCSLRVKGA